MGDSGTVDIIMVRHGESEWNLKNLFCGWYDAELSEAGVKEAQSAGDYLKNSPYKFDIAYTSMLKRAQNTLGNILERSGQTNVPIVKTWRLNERHYGALTGLNKVETVEKYGAEQVAIWRRSFDTPPPEMPEDHPYYDSIRNNPALKEDGPTSEEFPKTESLKLTIERTLPFWNSVIVPKLKEKTRILIVAHGNSLRGIVKHLDNISDEDITNLNLPTGIPFLYSLDTNLKPVVSMKFLGDPAVVAAAIEKVANQTKKK
ncbi:phosphoglycerate mutase 1-like [Coccinella septempunctata]|uniref:phosphoglycerate mutase 1-like n=1 Tax=Coccinella septempunctata TaxID=41139 RepID=UPI001D091EDA|nr:phosphoglycerate mutase 1-like [Coccinella septempunctata]